MRRSCKWDKSFVSNSYSSMTLYFCFFPNILEGYNNSKILLIVTAKASSFQPGEWQWTECFFKAQSCNHLLLQSIQNQWKSQSQEKKKVSKISVLFMPLFRGHCLPCLVRLYLQPIVSCQFRPKRGGKKGLNFRFVLFREGEKKSEQLLN